MRQIDCQFSTHCPEPGTEGPDNFKVQGVIRVLPIVNPESRWILPWSLMLILVIIAISSVFP